MNLLSRVVLAGAIALSMTGVAIAADMPPLPQTDAAYDGQVQELGTNWYLRGDVGIMFPGNDKMFNNTEGSALSRDFDIGLGFGYDFGAYRIDVSTDYFKKSASNVAGATNTYGTAPDVATTTLYSTYKNDNFLVLLNGFYNLGDWQGLTPFVGAGVGAMATIGHSDFDLWCVEAGAGTCPSPYVAGHNAIIPVNDQTWHPAGALMAGLSYKIDDNLSLDATYRFLAISHADFSGSSWQNRYENQIRLGFRYKVD